MATLTTDHKLGKHRRPFVGCPVCFPAPETIDVPERAVSPEPGERRKRTVKVVAKAILEGEPVPTPSPETLALPAAATSWDALTREAWMIAAVAKMRAWFPESHPVPEVRVSIGWPAGRGSSKLIGQCWYTTADKAPALFVSPELEDPARILDVLLHEMVHAATPGTGHKGAFISVAKHVGLQKPWTATKATDELKPRLVELAAALGDFPHAKVSKIDALKRPSVQSTRMLKVTCPEDGYSVRTTRKWIEVGLPSCPDGHPMVEDAA